jgi:hypothetical protein
VVCRAFVFVVGGASPAPPRTMARFAAWHERIVASNFSVATSEIMDCPNRIDQPESALWDFFTASSANPPSLISQRR